LFLTSDALAGRKADVIAASKTDQSTRAMPKAPANSARNQASKRYDTA
jgi:hypothetical protein